MTTLGFIHFQRNFGSFTHLTFKKLKDVSNPRHLQELVPKFIREYGSTNAMLILG